MPQLPDDPSIPRDAVLLRRIIPDWIPADQSRPNKVAFQDTLSWQVSFFVKGEISPVEILAHRPNDRLVEVDASFVRNLGYTLARQPHQGGHAHVVMSPPDGIGRSRLDKDARAIAKHARWV